VTGRKVTVTSVQGDGPAVPAAPATASGNGEKVQAESKPADKPAADKKAALRQQALADAGVQALLEVLPAEIRDVEEM